LTIVLVVGSGCATAQAPSPAQARQPTPGTVTRDNPGGDADNPIDAALERLLSEPIGKKTDRWRTVGARLPDYRNWKRVRFWGYPTRAGFRYGKNPHIAVGMLSYTPAGGDDSPQACLQKFVKKARDTADLFDVEVGEAHREMRTHMHGPEAVAWEQRAAEWEVERKKRLAERKKRLAELRKKKRERLKKARERWRKLRVERRRQAAAKRAASAAKAPNASIPVSPNAPAKADAPDGSEKDSPTEKPQANAEPEEGAAATADEKPDEDSAATPRAQRAKKRRRLLRRIQRAKRRANKKKKQGDTPPSKSERAALRKKKRRAQSNALRERLRLIKAQPFRRVPLPKNIPDGEMAVLRSSGKFNTLLKRDHYEVAVVAYEAWPGTCLVQGFAVRVGTDVMLARRVVTRWLDEAAPILRWASWLRTAPPFKDR
jgi:hypothetical protein